MSGLRNKSSFKIVLLGDPGVGKTSIRRRYLGRGFEKNYNVTLGADFAVKRLPNSGLLQIWDLAGQPVYKSVRSGYYKGAEGVILIFDITNTDSFKNLAKWLDEMVSISQKIVPIVLVGNKTDLRGAEEDTLLSLDGENYAKQLSNWSGFQVQYVESSALTGQNVDIIFENLIEEINIQKSMEQGN